MPYIIPVTWNIGTTPSDTDSAVVWPHTPAPTMFGINVRWLCMQPFGSAVVPEV